MARVARIRARRWRKPATARIGPVDAIDGRGTGARHRRVDCFRARVGTPVTGLSVKLGLPHGVLPHRGARHRSGGLATWDTTPRTRVARPFGWTIDDTGRAVEFNLADLFESVVDQVGTKPPWCLALEGSPILDLDRRANRLAHYFEGVGIGPGDHIGLQLANGTEYIEAMLACFKIRAVPINVNYRYRSGELRYIYEDAALAGLIFHSRFAGEVTGALGAMPETRGDAGGSPTAAAPRASPMTTRRHWSRRRPHGSSLRGGPTISTASTPVERRGCPRGFSGATTISSSPPWAAVTRLSLGNHIAVPGELAERVLRPGMTALAIPPFIHAAGHWLAFSTMFGGGKIVTLENGIFDPSDVWRLVEVESVNVIAVVGDAMARPLLDVLAAEPDRYDLSSLMAVGSGGALLSPSTKAQLTRLLPGRVVADRFGSSETGQVGGEAPTGDPFGPPRLHVDDRTDVFDADLQPVRPGSGAIGRLARGGHVPIGYLGDAAKSADDVRRAARAALGAAGRPGVGADRRDHHRARARVAVHQHRRVRRSFPTRWRRR